MAGCNPAKQLLMRKNEFVKRVRRESGIIISYYERKFATGCNKSVSK